MTNPTTQAKIPENLYGKRAIITGASKGIGADIAVTFAKAGADIAIIGRSLEGLEKTHSLVEQCGRRCLIVQADLADAIDVENAAKKILKADSHWDILVNNAGIAKNIPLLEARAEDWDIIYQTNLRAAFLMAKYIVPQMIQRRSGKIINISSMGTFYGTPGLGAYAASKAGMNQLTQTMAVEWGQYDIQINAVCPTVVLTEMGKEVWDDPAKAEMRASIERRIPLHRFANPQEIANIVLFLAGPGSSFINGIIIPVDDGARLNPA